MRCPYDVGAIVRANENGDIYRLLCRLGDGASAFVFEAGHLRTGERVALKLLRQSVSAKRMDRECAPVQALAHSSIVRLLDFGFTRDDHHMPYLVMPLLRGASLRTVLDSQPPLGVERGIDYGSEIFAALAHAHAAKLLHGDLRPANIFVERLAPLAHGVVLMDFGLSSALSEDFPPTQRSIGDPRYAAPELFYGHAPSVATDLYAAGLVLFEMLTGTHALGAASNDWGYTHYFAAAPPLQALLPAAPAALVALLASLLAKPVRERPPSAEACVDALSAIQKDLFVPGSNSTTEDGVDSMLKRIAGPDSEEDTQVDPPPPSLLREASDADDTDERPPLSFSNWPISTR